LRFQIGGFPLPKGARGIFHKGKFAIRDLRAWFRIHIKRKNEKHSTFLFFISAKSCGEKKEFVNKNQEVIYGAIKATYPKSIQKGEEFVAKCIPPILH
jgi:hypothetical protein